MSTANPEVLSILDELRELGASVETGERLYSEAEITEAEERLGFSLPLEYREFLSEFGQIEIVLERTWFFYGLEEGLEKTEEYRATFQQAVSQGSVSKRSGPYYPQNFFVLYDEGDYSNQAWGWVHDHDLDALLFTAGGKWVEAGDAVSVGYWGFLLDELTEILDRIADPEDVLVAGSERELALLEERQGSTPEPPKEET